jgi:hypothetical protein
MLAAVSVPGEWGNNRERDGEIKSLRSSLLIDGVYIMKRFTMY